VFIIRKGVVQQDGRLLIRVLRQLTAVRAKLTQPVLRALTKQYLPALTKTVEGLKVRAHANNPWARGVSFSLWRWCFLLPT